jgi:hypothetical protein
VRRRILRGGLLIVPLLAGVVVPASSALAASPHKPSGSIGIRLVDVPANPGNNALARSYIVNRLAPGTTVRRTVEISNTTRSPANVAVYAAAAGLHGGTFGFAAGHSRNELSSWTSVNRRVLRLRRGAKAFETVTIKVPKQASSGERYAVLWAEVSATPAAGGGIRLVNRVGVRLYLSIGPGGAAPSNFAIGSLTATRSATGQPIVLATIHNSGGRTISISGNLTLSNGPGGLRAGPFPVTLGSTLAPDNSESATVLLDKRLPRGSWRAQLRLTSGFIQRSAEATITFPWATSAAKPPGSRHAILVVSLALLGAAVFAFLISPRADPRRGHLDSAPTVSQ